MRPAVMNVAHVQSGEAAKNYISLCISLKQFSEAMQLLQAIRDKTEQEIVVKDTVETEIKRLMKEKNFAAADELIHVFFSYLGKAKMACGSHQIMKAMVWCDVVRELIEAAVKIAAVTKPSDLLDTPAMISLKAFNEHQQQLMHPNRHALKAEADLTDYALRDTQRKSAALEKINAILTAAALRLRTSLKEPEKYMTDEAINARQSKVVLAYAAKFSAVLKGLIHAAYPEDHAEIQHAKKIIEALYTDILHMKNIGSSTLQKWFGVINQEKVDCLYFVGIAKEAIREVEVVLQEVSVHKLVVC
jgi:hypothetical protein